MTINSETRVAGPFDGNDSTVSFPFTFKVFDSDEVRVVAETGAVETDLKLGTDYTVTLNADQNAAPGGSVVLAAPLPTGTRLTLTSALGMLQPVDLTNQGGFYPRVINSALDRLTILLQQLASVVSRTLKFPLSDGPVGNLPARAVRAGTVLAFDKATGEPVAGPDIASVNGVAGALVAVNTVANNIVDVNTVADNIVDVSNFSGVYYGPSAANPTTRRDGSPLQVGDLYFNTVTNAMRAYNGSAWRDSVTGAVTVQNLSGDGVKTEFLLNYAPESEVITNVFIGGVYQQKNTYALGGANGDVLIFNQAPPAGTNNIEVVVSSLTPSDDKLRQDLAAIADPLKGAGQIGRSGQVAGSIAALRLLDKTAASKHAFVAGYYAEGDGGGGPYYLDVADTTSLDNGGTIIVAGDGGRWKLLVTDSVSIKQFGARGNSNGTTGNGADDTAFIQAAINYVKGAGNTYSLYIPEGVFRCTAPLNVDGAVRVFGLGVSPYDAALGVRGNGSWVYFDHTGKGFNIDGASAMSGIELSKFGTMRNQPAPSPGWTPNAHDYDIYINSADVYLDDMMLLNPTNGVFLTNGGYGRLEINRLRGQAFQTMVRIDESYDVVKIHNLHQWPFWQDNSDVHAYTKAYLDVIHMYRNDNPMLTNIFTIFARSGMRFSQNVAGKTSKVHVVNADFDRGSLGVFIDPTVTTGITGQFDNITHQAESGTTDSKAIFVQGNSSLIDFGNFRSDLTAQNAIRVEGTGNRLTLAGSTVLLNYDQNGGNFPAIEVLSGNTVSIHGKPNIAGGVGVGGKYGGAGLIYVDEWRAYTPTITAETGTITTVGTTVGRFKRFNDTLEFAVDITITTNGTGAGAVRATVPDTVVTMSGVAAGRELAVGGKMLSGTLQAGAALCDIRNYDNTYPASDGARLMINGSYQIA